MLVRPLQPDDLGQWRALWQGYLDFYRCDLAPEVTEHVWARLMDANDQPYGLVAVAADRLVGFVHYHYHLSTWSIAGYCYLEDLYVDARTRGAGAGRALIEAVYKAADARGVNRVYWHTERDNTRAQALYDKVASVAPFIQYRRDQT
jgi:GNAT superfamily N-acetyltransferase